MHLDRLTDDAADAHARVEAADGVLKDDLHVAAKRAAPRHFWRRNLRLYRAPSRWSRESAAGSSAPPSSCRSRIRQPGRAFFLRERKGSRHRRPSHIPPCDAARRGEWGNTCGDSWPRRRATIQVRGAGVDWVGVTVRPPASIRACVRVLSRSLWMKRNSQSDDTPPSASVRSRGTRVLRSGSVLESEIARHWR